MRELRFEWDERKNKANARKHGITFEEARTVFYDKNALRYFDPGHSEKEDRFLLLGVSFQWRVLVVCHCFRKRETAVRIVSARKADKREKRYYRSGRA